jgi:hypothetical protein
MIGSRLRRVVASVLTYAGIIAVTLLAVDGICIAFGLFPPTHNYGDPELGWRPAGAGGRMTIGKCVEFSTGQTVIYARNEDGVRTSLTRAEINSDSTHLRIGVTGDSQTDLCAPNDQIHSGVLEADLAAHGVAAMVLTYGAGRYSPLQAYLAFRTVLRPYRPQVLVLNVYTGNDFYDILRVDDRPHFEPTDSGYRIAPPVWYSLDDPADHSRSRVLFAIRTLGDRLGVRGALFRMAELRRLGAQQGAGLFTVLGYVRDLLNARDPSLGYPDALTAQMLNQQLFFHHFPGSERESIRRMGALMTLVRRENPGLVLVMSPLPSYELVGEHPVDPALPQTLERLPISYQEGEQQERGLYEQLRALAVAQDWIFVDNLATLKAYHGPERLYNGFDYHLLPAASALVGKAQAAALLAALHTRAR